MKKLHLTLESFMSSKKDFSEDMAALHNLVELFESKFKDKLDMEVYEEEKPKEYLGYGASKIYKIKHKYESEENKLINLTGMLWLSSEINPNGVSRAIPEPTRTYTIHFELKAKETSMIPEYEYDDDDDTDPKSIEGSEYERTDEVTFKKFHDYALTPEEVVDEFENFLHDNPELMK